MKAGAVGAGAAWGRAEMEERRVVATKRVDERNCILTIYTEQQEVKECM